MVKTYLEAGVEGSEGWQWQAGGRDEDQRGDFFDVVKLVGVREEDEEDAEDAEDGSRWLAVATAGGNAVGESTQTHMHYCSYY